MKETLAGIVAVLLLLFGPFTAYMLMAPKYEAVKREVFEQSKEYQHGTIQILDKIHTEHLQATDPAVKAALLKRAQRIAADFDNLPSDLSQWLEGTK